MTDMTQTTSHARRPDRAAEPQRKDPPRVSSRDLLGPNGMVIIEHDGCDYRLLRTRQGKLLLNT